jgi:ribosomal protein S18 acetylase RimI-like enzyme
VTPTAPAISVRPATEADADVISDLLTDLGHAMSAEQFLARFRRLAERAPDDRVIVAAARELVVGLLVIHFIPVVHRVADLGRISALVVAPDFRNQGIGKTLVRYAEEIISSRGAARLELTSGSQRLDAHRFYESLGYVRDGVRLAKELDR